MTDSADDLILKMQHLEAQAKADLEGRGEGDRARALDSVAQKMALQAQKDVSAAERDVHDGEVKVEQAKRPGMKPLDAAELAREGREQYDRGQHALVKARAKLNFALDQMDEAQRRAYDAFALEARAAAHGELANDDPRDT